MSQKRAVARPAESGRQCHTALTFMVDQSHNESLSCAMMRLSKGNLSRQMKVSHVSMYVGSAMSELVRRCEQRIGKFESASGLNLD